MVRMCGGLFWSPLLDWALVSLLPSPTAAPKVVDSICVAVKAGNVTGVKSYLAGGVDANFKDELGTRPAATQPPPQCIPPPPPVKSYDHHKGPNKTAEIAKETNLKSKGNHGETPWVVFKCTRTGTMVAV